MVQHKAPHREWSPSPAHVGDLRRREDPRARRRCSTTTATAPTPPAGDDAHRRRPAAGRRPEGLSTPTARYGRQLLQADERRRAGRLARRLRGREQGVQQRSARRRRPRPLEVPALHEGLPPHACSRSTTASAACSLISTKSGLADNTVVIYASDQGFYLGEHGWFDKRFMYEQSLRTPLLVRWPGVAKAGHASRSGSSRTSTSPRRFSNWPASTSPADMQGRSLVPLLKGEPPDDWRKTFYYHYYEGPPAEHTVAEHYGVTDGRYKLIHYYKLDQWELFDLADDPDEMHERLRPARLRRAVRQRMDGRA